MRLILSVVKYWIDGILNHGWLFVIGHIIPVYISQDCNWKNKGYDIFSLTYTKTHYWYGLIINNPYYKSNKGI